MTVPALAPLSLSSAPTVDRTSVSKLSGPSLESALQDFEAIFVSMLLKEMRNSVGKSFFGDDKADALGGMFDMILGEELSRNGGMGISSALARYREVAEMSGPQVLSGEAA